MSCKYLEMWCIEFAPLFMDGSPKMNKDRSLNVSFKHIFTYKSAFLAFLDLIDHSLSKSCDLSVRVKEL